MNILSEIPLDINKLDREWFYSEINRRLSEIERSANRDQCAILSKEVISLYSFFIYLMREINGNATEILRSFYYDSQYIIENGFIDLDYIKKCDFSRNKETQNIVMSALPKHFMDEEPERSSLQHNLDLFKTFLEYTLNPSKSRLYVMNSLETKGR